MSNNQKTIILNYQLALQAAAGNEQLADNLLAIFIKQLPEYIKNINFALENIDVIEIINLVDIADLQNNIHKLNGALRYIGAPSLSQLVSELDGQLENLPKKDLALKLKLILDSLENISIEEKYNKVF